MLHYDTEIFYNSEAQLLFIDQNSDKQTEIESRGVSNEPFSFVENARINCKLRQTNSTSSVRFAIRLRARNFYDVTIA